METTETTESPRDEGISKTVEDLRAGNELAKRGSGIEVMYRLPNGSLSEAEYNRIMGGTEKSTVADLLSEVMGQRSDKLEILREVLGDKTKYLDMTPQQVSDEVGGKGPGEDSARFSDSAFNSHLFQLRLNAASEGLDGLTYHLFVERDESSGLRNVKVDHVIASGKYTSLVALGLRDY